MKTKYLVFFTIVFVMFLLLIGCNSSNETTESNPIESTSSNQEESSSAQNENLSFQEYILKAINETDTICVDTDDFGMFSSTHRPVNRRYFNKLDNGEVFSQLSELFTNLDALSQNDKEVDSDASLSYDCIIQTWGTGIVIVNYTTEVSGRRVYLAWDDVSLSLEEILSSYEEILSSYEEYYITTDCFDSIYNYLSSILQ